MKRKLPGALFALILSVGLGAGQHALAAGSHEHDSHAAHGQDGPTQLQLNQGRKWATDAPLRKSMAQLRSLLHHALPEIHEDKLPAADYDTLAHKIETEVGTIVANCKLDPQADAQLHLIVAELLAGAEQMAGKVAGATRQDGAVKVVTAMNNYAKYFADARFKPIRH